MSIFEYKFAVVGVLRSDGLIIPEDSRNKDWIEYLKWVKDGGKTTPQTTLDEAKSDERRWRDVELDGVKWLRERHRDEIELAAPTTLTPDEYSELLAYIQRLRDWPASEDFPSPDHRPAKPEWIALQIQ